MLSGGFRLLTLELGNDNDMEEVDLARIWSVDSGRLHCTAPPLSPVTAVARDGRTFAGLLAAHHVILSTSSCEVSYSLVPNLRLWDAGYIDDGDLFAVIAHDGMVLQWNISTGAPLPIFGASFPDTFPSMLPFPDGVRVATFDDGNVMVWNSTSGNMLLNLRHTLRFALWSAAVSLDGRLLAVCNATGAVDIWDLVTGASTQFRPAGVFFDRPVCYLEFGLVPGWELNSFPLAWPPGEVWPVARSAARSVR